MELVVHDLVDHRIAVALPHPSQHLDRHHNHPGTVLHQEEWSPHILGVCVVCVCVCVCVCGGGEMHCMTV